MHVTSREIKLRIKWDQGKGIRWICYMLQYTHTHAHKSGNTINKIACMKKDDELLPSTTMTRTTMLTTANKITRKQHSFTLLILFHFHISNLSEMNVVVFMGIKSLSLPSLSCLFSFCYHVKTSCVSRCVCHIFSYLKNSVHVACIFHCSSTQNFKMKTEPREKRNQLEF